VTDRIRDFKGLNAIVTGGSSGIGLEVARTLLSKGAKITLMARERKRLESASSELGSSELISVDVSDTASVSDAFSVISGGIDILVNCAGIAHPGRFQDLDRQVLRRTVEVNLIGTMNACSCALPMMSEGGHIVNISSIAGIVGLYGYTAYSASKFGVIGFSEALRMELVPRGIGVSVVLPPDTRTPQLVYEEALKPPETRAISSVIEPQDPAWVADRIVEAMSERRFLVVLTAKGKGVHAAQRLVPGLTRWFLDWKVRTAER